MYIKSSNVQQYNYITVKMLITGNILQVGDVCGQLYSRFKFLKKCLLLELGFLDKEIESIY